MKCIDCVSYEICHDIITQNTVECFILRSETCPNCKEKLQPSTNEATDLICPCCLREFEIHNGRLICTI